MNLICLGGCVTDDALALKLIEAFLNARFSGAECRRRCLAKVAAIELRK